MRKIIGLILLIIIAFGIAESLSGIPFGVQKTKVGSYYIDNGVEQTGAVNIVTSVVLSYRGFDTLGEVTVLFLASTGLGAILATVRKKDKREYVYSSIVLKTGCRFLSPFIMLFAVYIFLHGHLTPGGGFQGGAIIASGFLLVYLGCRERRASERSIKATESLSGLTFVIIGLLGLAVGGYFLFNFLPKGVANTLLSAGILPLLYIAIGFKVGSEFTGIIDGLIEESE
jgi:multicomponent Na+:H+ antiporter subunit B